MMQPAENTSVSDKPLLRRVTPAELLARPAPAIDAAARAVAGEIVRDVRDNGEPALRKYVARFGECESVSQGQHLLLGPQALQSALAEIAPEMRDLLERTAARITRFAQAQRAAMSDISLAVPGGTAGHRLMPVRRAACYAPAGRYPLPSSVLMTACTARAAGVPEVYVLTPRPSPIILAAAAIAGADGVLCAGGAQAAAACAYGIAMPRCDVLVGPGNKYFTAAKAELVGTIGIDMLAGPSEVLIIADDSANAALVAADLLAQAEHDDDARAILLTDSGKFASEVEQAMGLQLAALSTRQTAGVALARAGVCCICDSIAHAAAIADELAPEHLEVFTRDAARVTASIRSYGAVFVGQPSAEVIGDYGIGPNHTLPTGGSARFSSGLNVGHFLTVRTFVAVTDQAACAEMYADAVALAALEGLPAHRAAAGLRLSASSGGPTAMREIEGTS